MPNLGELVVIAALALVAGGAVYVRLRSERQSRLQVTQAIKGRERCLTTGLETSFSSALVPT